MIKFRTLKHSFVNDIPESLDPGVLYVSMRYATAMHLCCCGCGREVVTPLSPAQWKMTFDGETVSLHPSIGNWNVACRSHYIIRNGRVIGASSWSDDEVVIGQERDRRARSAYFAGEAAKNDDRAARLHRAMKKRNRWLSAIGDFITNQGTR